MSKLAMPQRNLRMFAELIGRKDIAKSVVFATTMWDRLESKFFGDNRETALKEEYWNATIDDGATVERFLNTPDSAWGIIDNIVKNDHKRALLLQEGVVDQKKHFTQTNVGEALYLDIGRGNYNESGTHGAKEPP